MDWIGVSEELIGASEELIGASEEMSGSPPSGHHLTDLGVVNDINEHATETTMEQGRGDTLCARF